MNKKERKPYKPPAVIYRDLLRTRAGSPLSEHKGKSSVDPFDPSNLFGND